MKHSLGRRPLEVKFAFILMVTLLLPGVKSRSIVSTTPPSVASWPKVGDLEEDHVLEPNSEGEDSTEPDGTLEDHDIEAVNDINETATVNLGEPPVVTEGTRTNDESDEDDALALFSLLVKGTADEDAREMMDDSEEGEPETNSVDEDKFSISDLPKLLKPLIDTFSDESNSEAPSKDDFLSWFPSLKDLFEPNKPSGTGATNSATRSGRRSSFSVVSEPPPVSAKPPELEILSSSQPVPTITSPPITIATHKAPPSKRPITVSPPEDSDSDEDSDTDF